MVPGGFPWEALPEGTKIVDVGGGIGTACHEIMKKKSLLTFTVQDLPSVTDHAIAVSVSTFPFCLDADIDNVCVVLGLS